MQFFSEIFAARCKLKTLTLAYKNERKILK
jgi:hypothetical protein